MTDKDAIVLRENAPRDELQVLIMEATKAVEDDLALEDTGWINLSGTTSDIISAADKINNVKLSRLYAAKDPLGKQAIRLWTDYTFGTGMTWSVDDRNAEGKKAKGILEEFWNAKANRNILGAIGQRVSSNKLLVDGVIYFAIFLGQPCTIRRIDPLEITEIITDPDDKEDVKFYKREWSDQQATPHTDYYRSTDNIKGQAAKDFKGATIKDSEKALIYRLEYNDGNPLLLPALLWMKYHTRFLASRIAIMLALAKFAWKQKVKGGQAAVDAIKAKTHDKDIPAGSTEIENEGIDTTPIKTETGASAAYQDGRMLKLQIAAAVGIPEQYFGDISIGNLATAKTVELPMMKMFQSYQQVWNSAYQDIDELILEHNGANADIHIDRDFPKIAPSDVVQIAQALVQILTVMPELGSAADVQQIALMALGVNDPADVLEELAKEPGETQEHAIAQLTKAIRQLKESLKKETQG